MGEDCTSITAAAAWNRSASIRADVGQQLVADRSRQVKFQPQFSLEEAQPFQLTRRGLLQPLFQRGAESLGDFPLDHDRRQPVPAAGQNKEIILRRMASCTPSTPGGPGAASGLWLSSGGLSLPGGTARWRAPRRWLGRGPSTRVSSAWWDQPAGPTSFPGRMRGRSIISCVPACWIGGRRKAKNGAGESPAGYTYDHTLFPPGCIRTNLRKGYPRPRCGVLSVYRVHSPFFHIINPGGRRTVHP